MRINFRQGLIAFQKDNGSPVFLHPSSTSGYISHVVAPTPTVITAAHGSSDYLMHFDQAVDLAWGPVVPNVTNYLYWDMDLLTGEITRGITTHPLIVSALEPAQLEGQHWFDLGTTTMKVWSTARNKWQTKVRVFAGSVTNGNTNSLVHYSEGTQASLNVPGNPGYIMRDHMLQPLRKSNGEFLTDDSPVHVDTTVGTSGVLVQPVNRIVPVRAGETIPAMSLVYFSADDTVRLASSNPALVPMRVPVGIMLESLTVGDVGHLSPFGEISYDQWDWSGHAGEPLYVDFSGGLTLTRPAGLLAFRVGFVKNKNTVLLGIDAETYPQVYQSDVNSLVIAGQSPVAVQDVVNGIGERVVTISVPLAGAQPGLMTPLQATQLTGLDGRITATETGIANLQSGKANVSHTHVIADTTGLQAALDTKADLVHTHNEYSPTNHDHDDTYSALGHTHTAVEVDGLQGELNQKANRVHLNSFGEVYTTVDRTGTFDVGSGQTLSAALAGKSDVGHGHIIGDVTGLQTALDDKTDIGHGHAIADVMGLQSDLNNRAMVVHTHNISSVTGLQTELDSKVGPVHTHVLDDITDVSVLVDDIAAVAASVDGKADVVHAHDLTDITGLQTALNDKAAAVHTHAINDVTGLQTALNGKAATGHAHVISDVTGLQTALNGKAATVHTHVIADVTGLQSELDGKATAVHAHVIADVTGLQTELDGKADDVHTHAIADVTGLQSELDDKATVIHGHTISDVADLQTELDGKAATIHAHAISDVADLQTELDGKAATVHVHAIADVTDLQTELDGKAATVHAHAISDVTGLQTELDDLQTQIDNAGGNPGGTNGQIQYNGAGSFAGASITTDGTNLLIGSATSRQVGSNNFGGQVFGTLQLEQASASSNTGGISSAVIIRNAADASGARLVLAKSYGTTVGSNVAIPVSTRIGEISFDAATGGANGIVSTATIFSSTLTNGGVTNTGGRAALFFSTMNSDQLTSAVRVSLNGNDTSGNLNLHVGTNGFSINGYSGQTASLSSPTFQTIIFDGSGGFITFRASSASEDGVQLRGKQFTLGTSPRTSAAGLSDLALLAETTVGSQRTATAAFISNSTTAASGSVLALGRTRSTSHNQHTAVASADALGSVIFFGANGTNTTTVGARIDVFADQAFTTSTCASRFSFKTTPIGSVTPTEAVQIKNDGELAITRAGAGLRFPDNSIQTTAATAYSLPTASNTVLGGVKVGTGLAIDGGGLLSVAPAGSDTQVQYNNAGVLGASSSFTFNGTLLSAPEIQAVTTFESPEVWAGDSRHHTVSGTIASTVTDPIATIDTTTFNTAKVLVTIEDGTDIHVVEYVLASVGGSAYATAGTSVLSNAALGTFSFDMSGTDMRLLFENTGAVTVNYKAVILEN